MKTRLLGLTAIAFLLLGDCGLAFWHKTDPATGRGILKENVTNLESNSAGAKSGEMVGTNPMPGPEGVSQLFPSEQQGAMLGATAKESSSSKRAMNSLEGFSSGPGLLGLSLQSFGALLLVLTIILLGTHFLKRLLPGRFGPVSNKRNLKIVETLQLGDKRSLHLLQVGDRMILVGCTSSQITVLEQMEDAVAHPVRPSLEEVKSNGQRVKTEAHAAGRSSFARFFKRADQTRNTPVPQNSESHNFENILGKEIIRRASANGREATEHASRLAALRQSLQSHQRV